MANNPKHMDNLTSDNQFTSGDKHSIIARKGGVAKGKADRLNTRLLKAATFIDRQNLRKDKKDFKLLWKSRNMKHEKQDEIRESLKVLIEKMRMIRYCGSDSLAILAIANNPLLALTKPEVVIKAQAELWDRTEGKAIQSVVTTGSNIREKIVVTQEELDEEAKRMQEEFDND